MFFGEICSAVFGAINLTLRSSCRLAFALGCRAKLLSRFVYFAGDCINGGTQAANLTQLLTCALRPDKLEARLEGGEVQFIQPQQRLELGWSCFGV